MLLQILSPYVDIFHQALASMGSPLLDGVLGTQSEHCHVLQGQTEAAEASVKLLGETLSHLVALVLERSGEDKKKGERKTYQVRIEQTEN